MSEIYPIIPASAKPLWFIGILGLLFLSLVVVFAVIGYAARNSRVEVGRSDIRLVGDFWGRSIPLSSLKLDIARPVDLSRTEELRPRWRTFGTAIPGYASGWFRLRNGEKALAYLTDRGQVAYIPTTDGYSLLLSVEQPDQFIGNLRERAP